MEVMIARFLVFSSCGVLVAVPLFFICNRVYKDGAVGRMALAAISFFSAGIFVESIFGFTDSEVMWRLAVGLIVSFAVFIFWHLWRFHRRVLNPSSDPLPERRPASALKVAGRK